MEKSTINALWIGDPGPQGEVVVKHLKAGGSDRIAVKRSEKLSAGLRRLSGGNVDVVLLDLFPPESEGLAAFLRVHESAPEIPTIVITGMDNRELADRAVDLGAWDFIVREEITGPLVVRAINEMVERRRLETEIDRIRDELDQKVRDNTREIERENSNLRRQLVERLRVEQDLSASEKRYRSIVEDITYIMYYTTDINGYATYVNRACAEITGYTVDELLGMHYLQMIHPEWREKAEVLYRGQFTDRTKETTMDFPIQTRDGEEKWVEQKVKLLSTDGYVTGFQGIVRDITDRKKARDKLQAALNEKEVLLKEIHHRMKNNLLAISGLLHFQETSIKDEDSRRALANCQKRIMSMAVIHEKLYQMEDLANVNIGDYIRTLADHLVRSFSSSPDDITVAVPVDDIRLNVETAVPCGLIITELITNTLEYAFPDTAEGTIRIELTELPDRKFILTVSDDGVGLPAVLDIEKAGTLGLILIRTLIEGLGGTMTIDREAGTTFRFEFTEYHEGKTEPIAELSPPY
jgi:PAS domain S-box-containing protein